MGTWALGNGQQNLQDFNSYQISANSQTNHNTQHAVNHTNQNLRQLRGDNGLPLSNSRTNKLQQLLGDPNDEAVAKTEKSKNTLSKWFSSLKKRRKSKSPARPMVEILFDQEYSRDDYFLDQMSDNGFVPEYRRRKYSDPTGTEKPLYLRYGSLDRRPWIRREIDQDQDPERRHYGSLDRRAQSQILTRWNGTGMQDLRFDDAPQNTHQHYGSSSESEATQLMYRQQQSQDDFMTAAASDRLSSGDKQFWSPPRQNRKPNSMEPAEHSNDTSHDIMTSQTDNQNERISGNVEWSLPRNFKLKPNTIQGIVIRTCHFFKFMFNCC